MSRRCSCRGSLLLIVGVTGLACVTAEYGNEFDGLENVFAGRRPVTARQRLERLADDLAVKQATKQELAPSAPYDNHAIALLHSWKPFRHPAASPALTIPNGSVSEPRPFAEQHARSKP